MEMNDDRPMVDGHENKEHKQHTLRRFWIPFFGGPTMLNEAGDELRGQDENGLWNGLWNGIVDWCKGLWNAFLGATPTANKAEDADDAEPSTVGSGSSCPR